MQCLKNQRKKENPSGGTEDWKQEVGSINKNRPLWEDCPPKAHLFSLCTTSLGELIHFKFYNQYIYAGDFPIYTSNITSPLTCSTSYLALFIDLTKLWAPTACQDCKSDTKMNKSMALSSKNPCNSEILWFRSIILESPRKALIEIWEY